MAPGRPELARHQVGHARNIVFLTGAKDTGKVHAGRGCVLTAQLRGMKVVHVELPEDVTLPWHRILRAIAQGVASWLQEVELDAAVQRFSSELDKLVATIEGAGPNPLLALSAGVAPIGQVPMQPAHYQDEAFELFRSFLRSAAGGAPLLLAIDNVGRTDELDVVVRHLFTRAARCEPALLLVVGMADVPRPLADALPHDLYRRRAHAVEPFRKVDAELLTVEFCVRRRARRFL